MQLVSVHSRHTQISQVIKLLNHPTLLLLKEQAIEQSKEEDNVTDLTLGTPEATVAVDMDFVKRHFPSDYNQYSFEHSGKLCFLFELLKSVHATTSDRFVVVSNYTTTLDILESFCEISKYA